jgi:uncharacterized membrane protein YedE/YeeE
MIEFIKQPWPWYVTGLIIGLTIPLLLLLGNKPFGISSSFRHLCAACLPSKIPYFKYSWKNEIWNLFFVGGIVIGAAIATLFLSNPEDVKIAETTKNELLQLGIKDFNHILPNDIFNWKTLLTVKGFVFILLGGFLIGFGT